MMTVSRILAFFLLLSPLGSHAQWDWLDNEGGRGFYPWERLLLQVNPCQQILGPLTVKHSIWDENVERSGDTFLYEDQENDFHFRAHLGQWNILELDVYLKNQTRGIRSRYSGRKLFNKAIRYFGKRNISAIRGSWIEGDNLSEFQSNIKNGMTRENAALNTWTGRMAASHGFSEVIFTPSAATSVRVLFTRPGSPLLKGAE